MNNIPIVWFSNLKTQQEKNDFKQALTSSVALRRLKEIIHSKLEVLETQETDYNNPSWSHLQAHYNGKREVLKEINQLLSFIA